MHGTYTTSLRRHWLKLTTLALWGLLALGCNAERDKDQRSADGVTAVGPAAARPNILLVVVDDMGYSDIGAFGGEIPTPHLDSLAREGTRFSDFQVLPACSPTRAALLTGQEPHAVGFGSLAEELADNQTGTPAYAGALPADVPTLASILQQAGYRTYLSGKWHLGGIDDPGPKALGFDESFALIPGGASHFADMVPAYSPDPEAVAPYIVNDQLISELPDNYHYSSQFFAEELIRMIGSRPDKPFFAYLSFTAPHWPLHAPDEAVAQFIDTYSDGYERLRDQRLRQLKAEGLVPEDALQSALPPKVRAWSDLNGPERIRESRAMAVYAAMISEIDRHTGRVLAHLDDRGVMDNTLVVFLSDNGAEGHDLDETWSAELFPAIRAVIDERFDHSTEQMGRPGSYPLYGAGWAHAAAPHLRMYKAFTSEGGTRVTAFMRLPGTITQPAIAHTTVSVRDVLPTVLDVAGVAPPEDLAPHLVGRSLLPLLLNGARGEVWPDRPLVVEFLGKQAVRQGPWKLVQLPPPYGSGEFALYNLQTDLAERHDVSAQQPAIVAELLADYEAYKARYGVIEPNWVSGY